jgi:hypothetical protein
MDATVMELAGPALVADGSCWPRGGTTTGGMATGSTADGRNGDGGHSAGGNGDGGNGAMPEAPGARFESILFPRPGTGAGGAGTPQPDFFPDIGLDQVLALMTAGREEYDLEPLFRTPLRDAGAVRYRQEVLRDLQDGGAAGPAARFGEEMRRMRRRLARSRQLSGTLQRQAWFLDAAGIYCEAVRALERGLAACELSSRGLRGFRRYLREYAGSGTFPALAGRTRSLREALSGIRYTVRIHGTRVTVSRCRGEPDYGAEVAAAFSRFRQDGARAGAAAPPGPAEMNPVQERIVSLAARLYPEEFAALAEYCDRYRGFPDPVLARFEREAQFCLAYLELAGRLRAAGLPFCYPRVRAGQKETAAEGAFDIALASRLVPAGKAVTGNDFELSGPERVLVVTGPNNGGKTTFARAFGQLHYLASLGLPVPGRGARLFLPSLICTHFGKAEDTGTLRSGFTDELVRMRGILRRADGDSIIIMNESFGSATPQDALLAGTEVMRRILALGCLGVYVTFTDELASLSEATVSMVSQVMPGDAARRTFKVVRQPADGLACAWAIAAKYGLTYERLLERIRQ